jgi:hypothetical protein
VRFALGLQLAFMLFSLLLQHCIVLLSISVDTLTRQRCLVLGSFPRVALQRAQLGTPLGRASLQLSLGCRPHLLDLCQRSLHMGTGTTA